MWILSVARKVTRGFTRLAINWWSLLASSGCHFGGFPKLGVPCLGVLIIRTIVFWGLYWGTLIKGNYHFGGFGRFGRSLIVSVLISPMEYVSFLK